MSEPYFKWDPRPHGWFTANGLTKFGPLPQRETKPKDTWPPQALERPLTAHEGFMRWKRAQLAKQQP